MGMVPDTDKNNSDFIDLLTTACSKNEIKRDGNGRIITELQINTKELGYKLQMVSSNTYARFVFMKERLESLALDAYNYMEPERADVVSQQILRLVEAYGYSTDAKSSETLRDKNNSVSSLLHILNSKSTERKLTISEDVKKGGFAALFGGSQKRREAENA